MARGRMELLGLYLLAFIGVPSGVWAGGRWDCLHAGDTCSSDEACSPRLRTLRQCVAGDGSVKLGPGARNHCENAVTALMASPLHHCQCKRGMKKEKNCLSIYWSLQQTILHGFSLVEAYPYEPMERGNDYVRLASIAAESEAGMTTVNRCLDAAKACNVDEACQKLRTEYVSACIGASASARGGQQPCNRGRCSKALRKFFDRVPPEHTHELLFCPCHDIACAERRRQTIVPACSYEETPAADKPNCLQEMRTCKADYVCKSRWAQFQFDCQPSEHSASGCQHENYGNCLVAYTGLIGSIFTPNYLDNTTSNVGPWCSCVASGNHREQCHDILSFFHDNICLKKAILDFGNGTDQRGGQPSQPGATNLATTTPATNSHHHHHHHRRTTASTTTAIAMETEQNILSAQIPTQLNERDRLWGDDDTSPASPPGLPENSAGSAHYHRLVCTWPLPFLLLAWFH